MNILCRKKRRIAIWRNNALLKVMNRIKSLLLYITGSSPAKELSLRIFRNQARLERNISFWMYKSICSLSWMLRGNSQNKYSSMAFQRAAELRDRGYCVIPDAIDQNWLDKLNKQVAKLIRDERYIFRPPDARDFMMHLVEPLKNCTDVTNLLSADIIEAIESYYRCFCLPYSVEIYRTVPTQSRPSASFLWHSDNVPISLIKVMVYLTDTSQATGAFRIHPRPVTNKLINEGFRDRKNTRKLSQHLDSENTQIIFEGKKGTAIIFDNNIIHKATPPQYSYRDVVVFKFMPFHKKAVLDNEGIKHIHWARNVPTDPFVSALRRRKHK